MGAMATYLFGYGIGGITFWMLGWSIGRHVRYAASGKVGINQKGCE